LIERLGGIKFKFTMERMKKWFDEVFPVLLGKKVAV